MTEKILLVDDEQGICEVLGISLADLGYTVHTAQSGEQALDLFRKMQPLVVITDIKMPGMDGLTLLKKIKEEAPDTEVIVLTGQGDMDLAVQSLKAEATDFITKPISDEALSIALRRAREKIFMRQQLREYTENLENLVEEKTRELITSERMAAVGQTIAGLSHAIKNIASGLEGGVFVLEKGIELDEKKYVIEGWEMLKASVEKIKNLSLGLLEFAKSPGNNRRRCDPAEPLRQVARLMKSWAGQSGITIKMDFAPDLEPLYIDAEKLEHCLLNLVTNSLEACIEDTSGQKEKQITLIARRPEGWGVEYQILDNGPGMDEPACQKAFREFFSTKGARGTGLGLMLSNKIIEEHKGVIEIESEKGVGTKICIKLPLGG